MLSPQQFKQRWQSNDDERLIYFPESSLLDVRLPAEARAFLIEAGLPDQAAPFLDFAPPKNGTLQRVSVVWHQPAEFGRYRIIGGNGSGDPVCLDEDVSGQIVYLNHDNGFKRVLMASSIVALAECLVELRDVIAEAGDTEFVSPGRYDELFERLREIDPLACEPEGYWPQEIAMLKPGPP
jgi:hypothetical protein